MGVVAGEPQLDGPAVAINEHRRDGAMTCLDSVMIAGDAMALAEPFHAEASTAADEIARKLAFDILVEFRQIVADVFFREPFQGFCPGETVMLGLPAFGAPGEVDAHAESFRHGQRISNRRTVAAQVAIGDREAQELIAIACALAGVENDGQRAGG